MRRSVQGLVAVSAALSLALTACGDEDDGGSASKATGAATSGAAQAGGDKPLVGVVLPDAKSSNRWETADRKFLEEALTKAGVAFDIQNANGDKTQFGTLVDTMISKKAKVILMVNLDSASGKAAQDRAKAAGVKTIDYDRLTLGGSSDYYVSFDNEAVGKLQGEGLLKCLKDKGKTSGNIVYLNGSPTDNNATLFKNGYDGVLSKATEFKKVADESVPDWDNAKGGVIFEQMFTQQGGKIDGVAAANDGLANAAIAILKKNKVNGQVPITGQDATVEGLQNILAGDQCMTVYKAIKKEAEAAANFAAKLARGEDASADASAKVNDAEGKRDVPSVLLEPQAIFKDNVKDVIADGFQTKEAVCTGDFAAKCAEAGIS